jgi:cyclophilin family peptidyl-prolyl cis-trans isomerase
MKTENYLIVFALIALVIASGTYFFKQNKSTEADPTKIELKTDAQTQPESQQQAPQEQSLPVQKPTMKIDTKKTYTAILKTTEGDITVELNAKNTPITVDNFVTLAKKDFYDSTIFHRVMSGFMIQGGDPEGTGRGGPGYTISDEPFDGEYSRGTIAMARTAMPNSAGSQFFIMHKDYPLPKQYVIFGKVTDGMDIVDKIAEAKVTASETGEMSKPVTPVKVTDVEIIEK